MSGNIYYFSPDMTAPCGGLFAIYDHVRVLRDAGFNAWILHKHDGFAPEWMATKGVPIRYVEGNFTLTSDDVVVIPEVCSSTIQGLKDAPFQRIVFCQNQFYAAAEMRKIGDWRRYGVSGVVASTVKVHEFLGMAGWPDAPIIPYKIDTAYFRPSQKKMQIAYMPRKMQLAADAIIYQFQLRFPKLASVPFVTLHNVHRDQVAAVLRESAIFLTLGRFESLGLPALEAMASGALVAGFHGDGDLSLPEAKNSALWVHDVPTAVSALGTLVEWSQSNDPRADAQRQAGSMLVDDYSPAACDEALLTFWRRRMA